MKMKLSALTLAMLPVMAFAAPLSGTEYADDSVIVVYKHNVSAAEKRSVRTLVRATMSDKNIDGNDDRYAHILQGRIAKLQLSGLSVKQALEKLKSHPAVQIAEPNFRVSAEYIPADPQFGELWGLNNTGQASGVVDADIDAVEAWEITRGSADIVVGVIDTGINYLHPDLDSNIWQNPAEIPNNGIDDDGNGYVDDVHGIDVVNIDSDPMDDDGHGSHVSGTIGAKGDNGEGVVGVNHVVSIAGCKFLGADGTGSTAGAIECIDYFVALKQAGVNVRALNNSWGGGGYSETLEAAIEAAAAEDILFVAAAGNSGVDNDLSPHYPSSYTTENVLAVASVNRFDGDSGYSYGLESVDIGAPGTYILSTVLGTGYAYYSGTSMATPHVTGSAALVWSIAPDITAVEMKALLMESGDENSFLTGKTVSGKRLNVKNALDMADPEPGFGLRVTPRMQQISAGETAVYSVDVSSIADWDGSIELSVSGDLAGVALSQTSVSPGQSFTVSVPTTAQTAWGNYEFVLSAVSGELTKSVTLPLEVIPAGLFDISFSNTTPVAIPDNNPAGIQSVIHIADPITTFATSVHVDITHTYIGDLTVSLMSPAGTEAVLHQRTGGSADDLVTDFATDAFNGEAATGDWVLTVSDSAGADVGTLNSWGLTFSAIGDVLPSAPDAMFSADVSNLDVQFMDTSSDVNGDIASWSWDFGDGSSSTAQNPMHTYAATGVYTVMLTVTDAEGMSDSYSMDVAVSSISIEAQIERAMLSRLGNLRVDISWQGSPAQTVDIYRNGVVIATVANSGIFRDTERRVEGTHFVYQVCDTTSACSQELTVDF